MPSLNWAKKPSSSGTPEIKIFSTELALRSPGSAAKPAYWQHRLIFFMHNCMTRQVSYALSQLGWEHIHRPSSSGTPEIKIFSMELALRSMDGGSNPASRMVSSYVHNFLTRQFSRGHSGLQFLSCASRHSVEDCTAFSGCLWGVRCFLWNSLALTYRLTVSASYRKTSLSHSYRRFMRVSPE